MAQYAKFHEKTTATPTFAGGTGWSQASTLDLERIGNVIHINMRTAISDTSSTDNFTISATGALPANFRPTETREIIIPVDNGEVSTPYDIALMTINSSGDITFDLPNFPGFTCGAAAKIYAFSVSYIIS